ncbi:MAG: hypothetical protein LBQ58_12180 [Synergistaceae bacterium]|nr:hypothetical protein [Synergistaceae bacterium]
MIVSAIYIIAAIFALIKIIPQMGKPVPYIPMKGFRMWRFTPEQWLKYYKNGIYGLLVAVGLFALFVPRLMFQSIGTVIVSVFGIRYLMKRIKYHVPADDASLFELEELGLISENEVVLSLYKDFPSWKDVKDGSKVLVLTQDNFIVLNFSNRDLAEKFVFPLKGLERLAITQMDTSGGDVKSVTTILTMGFRDLPSLWLVLKGESHQDAPEVFISSFLREVDARLMKKPKPPQALKRAADVKAGADFRKIDIKSEDFNKPDSSGSARVIEL